MYFDINKSCARIILFNINIFRIKVHRNRLLNIHCKNDLIFLICFAVMTLIILRTFDKITLFLFYHDQILIKSILYKKTPPVK